MKDGKYELNDITIVPLTRLYNVGDFDCGDDDLNEFLKIDSFVYQEKKLASTVLIIEKERVIGFFSLCCDAIKLLDDEKQDCGISNKKPVKEYPAVKIARLAVDKNCQKKHLGTHCIQIAIGLIRDKLSGYIGCRFITVDSYYNKVIWYSKFKFLINEHSKYKSKDDYVSMRLDLLNPNPKNNS